jgi:hypothetical protein
MDVAPLPLLKMPQGLKGKFPDYLREAKMVKMEKSGFNVTIAGLMIKKKGRMP